MCAGVKVRATMGTPQGGPLSPLLANILLDDLDRELARRGHRFVRYADDCTVYLRSRRAGERVMAGVQRFLATRLKLELNQEKSAVDLAAHRGFLGCSLVRDERARIRLDPEAPSGASERSHPRAHEAAAVDRHDRAHPAAQRVPHRLGAVLRSGRATPSPFEDLDEWLRRRLRQCRWKEWKRGLTRKRNLLKLGLDEWSGRAGHSRKGPWRMANSPTLQRSMALAYWRTQGLLSIAERYAAIRNA